MGWSVDLAQKPLNQKQWFTLQNHFGGIPVSVVEGGLCIMREHSPHIIMVSVAHGQRQRQVFSAEEKEEKKCNQIIAK